MGNREVKDQDLLHTPKGQKCKEVTKYTDWQGKEEGLQQLCFVMYGVLYLGWVTEHFTSKDKCGGQEETEIARERKGVLARLRKQIHTYA